MRANRKPDSLVSVVLYCLALVCRYGAVLQKESDETL
jgi:hypothetical protein